MKLTNISLAILVAIGLVACGGSDDNKNQPTDNNNAGHQGNGNPPPPPPPKDESGLDPNRVAPDLTVPKDLQTDVNVSKATYLSRGFADDALGYPDDSRVYNEDAGTKPADIKFSTVYNYSTAGDLIDSRTAGFDTSAAGAIYVGDDPGDGRGINAFVKIGSKYYRVRADVTLRKNLPAGTNPDYKPDTKFVLVPPTKNDGGIKVDAAAAKALQDKVGYNVSGSGDTTAKYVKQSQVVFIANVKDAPWPVNAAEIADNNELLTVELGDTKFFKDSTGQTVLNTVSTLGNDYSPSATGQNLDFSKLPVDKDNIQFVDVNGKFTVSNDKGDNNAGNDFDDPREIDLGKIKAYNLPYSIAYVTVDPSKENVKNIFDLPLQPNTTKGSLANGSYQVRGYQTISLPKQGRAHYTGKSFNATVEGDVKLTADFFSDRAGVHGTVTNRKNIVTGKELTNLRLDLLTLTDPKTHKTFASTTTQMNGGGKVFGDPKVDSWSVQFYGLEAQEAGGKLYHSTTDYEEVYTTQRGKLTNLSNTSDVK